MKHRKYVAKKSTKHSIRQGVSADSRLFPTLQNLSFYRIVNARGIAKVAEAISVDQKEGGTSRDPGMRDFMHLLLIQAVVQGDISQAKKLIEQNPTLVSLKGDAIDYSHRTIQDVTPFQAALCAWDEEMCKMLMEYMQPEEIILEYNQIFPQGVETHCASQKPFNFSEIFNVISQSSDADVQAALSKEQNETTLCKALNQFRVEFTNLSCQEKIFNPQHLIMAYNKYIEFYDDRFDRSLQNKRALFWKQVVGFVQRFLPANIAQDVAQGIYHLVREKKAALRSFKFRTDPGDIFPLTFDSHSGLGFDYGVGAMNLNYGTPTNRTDASYFKAYIEDKQHRISLCNQPRNATRHTKI